MRPVETVQDKTFGWDLLKESWLACATCLNDDDFWEHLGESSLECLKDILVLLAKALATLLLPVTGVVLAISLHFDAKKRKAQRQQRQ